MQRRQRKLRLMTGAASLVFFIAASLCFGFALEGLDANGILGFRVSEDAVSILDVLPFFNTKAESKVLYPIGNVENQIVMVNLSEQKTAWLNEEKIKKAEQLLNNELTKYISDISKGGVIVHSTFYGYQDHNVQDGYVPSKPLSYYIEDQTQETQREAELLNEIIEQMNQNMALSDKTVSQLDTNDDGYIDNMTFLIRGNKQYEHNLLWPHQFSIKSRPTIECKDGSLKVKDYMIILSGDDENNIAGSRSGLFSEYVDMGVVAHEYLHLYGFPDMYHNYKYENDEFVSLDSSERKGDPLGQWDIMDNTINDIPQNPLYYTNTTYGPWGEQLNQSITLTESTKQVELHKLDYTKDETMAAVIKVDSSVNVRGEDEYFMVEYRKKSGWDEKLPSNGLIVYRINMAANYKNPEEAIRKYCSNKDNGKQTYCGNQFGPPDEVYIYRPNVTTINLNESGSHDFDLYDAALSADSRHKNTLGKSLSEVSSYEAKTLADTIYFSDGSNSGVVISNVSDTTKDTITFDIEIPEPKEDSEKPIIDDVVDGSGIAGHWTNKPASLSVYISDKGFGLEKIEVTTEKGVITDGEDPEHYIKTFSKSDRVKQTTFTFTAAKNGIYYIKATDFAGNQSKVKVVEVTNIDETPPVISFGSLVENPLEIQIPVMYEDRESGIASGSAYYVMMGLHEKADGTYPYEIKDHEIRVPADFQGRVCVTVKDNAGNAAKADTCMVISNDKQPPVLEIEKDRQDAQWTSMERSIKVIMKEEADKDTGISYVEISTENGIIHTDAEDKQKLVKNFGEQGKKLEEFTFRVSYNGDYMVKVCDYADFCSAESVHIGNIDRSAPVLSDIKISDDKDFLLFMNGAYNIRFVAHDEPLAANSGLKQIHYQLVRKGETYDADITSTKWKTASINGTISTEAGFEGTVYAYACDQVGNISKIFQKQITRITAKTAENVLTSSDQNITVYGINDPDVRIVNEEFNSEKMAELLGEEFMTTHEIAAGVHFRLEKETLPYPLSEPVTVHYALDQNILKQGTLQLLAVNEDGSHTAVHTKLGSTHLEFMSEEPAYAYVAVYETQSQGRKQHSVVTESTPQTGDIHNLYLYLSIMLGSLGTIFVWYGRQRTK